MVRMRAGLFQMFISRRAPGNPDGTGLNILFFVGEQDLLVPHENIDYWLRRLGSFEGQPALAEASLQWGPHPHQVARVAVAQALAVRNMLGAMPSGIRRGQFPGV